MSTCFILPLIFIRPSNLRSALVPNILIVCFSLSMEHQVSYPDRASGKINFKLYVGTWETRKTTNYELNETS
jgi:hypothetical protein